MSQKTKEQNSFQNRGSASLLATGIRPKGISFMIQYAGRLSLAVTWSLKSLITGHNNLEYAPTNVLTEHAQSNSLYDASTTVTTSKEIVVIDGVEDRDVPLPHWLKIGGITLYNTDKKDVLEGKWLSDAHINALQFLLKCQFPSINGFENTLTTPFNYLPVGSLQILHVNGG